MAATEPLALLPGYGPFMHTGASNHAHRKRIAHRMPDTFSLWGILDGSLRIAAPGEPTRVLAGPAAVLLAPDPHRTVEAPAGSDWYYLRFDLTDQPRRRRRHGEGRAWMHAGNVRQPGFDDCWGVVPFEEVPRSLCDSALQILRDCCSLWWQDDLAHIQANASLAHWLADYAMACRDLSHTRTPQSPMLRRCRALVLERLHQGITVADLAAASGYSPSRFAARFTEECGLRPGTLIRNCRLQEAARLLASEDLPVATIAGRCGYRSRAAFVRAFTRRYSSSPSQWRRRRR